LNLDAFFLEVVSPYCGGAGGELPAWEKRVENTKARRVPLRRGKKGFIENTY